MPIKPLKSPEHLRQFFQEKGHVNLVLRRFDVQLMDLKSNLWILSFLDKVGHHGIIDTIDPRYVSFLPEYLVVPWGRICDGRFSMDELTELQAFIELYKDGRRGRAYPVVRKECNCKYLPRVSKCKLCNGQGYTETLVEMSDEEIEIASGKQPNRHWW